jgi:hypothetical protein
MHIVYCDTAEVSVRTPDFNDAQRTFRQYCREYPTLQVDWFEEDANGHQTRVVTQDPN